MARLFEGAFRGIWSEEVHLLAGGLTAHDVRRGGRTLPGREPLTIAGNRGVLGTDGETCWEVVRVLGVFSEVCRVF